MLAPPITVWQGPFGAAQHAEFVEKYWQKQPLLIRGLLSPADVDEQCPLSVDSVLALAENPACSPRLVRERGGARPWECSRGPFASAELDSLPTPDGSLAEPWTLLVSGVDRQLDSIEALRESPSLWGFAPRWRIDDIQISHAPTGGSVGAHIDNYDVFLLQGKGTREWSVEGVPRGAADEDLVPCLDVRILQEFNPSDAWELAPGDALYLPPRFAHHGVSTSADCLTYSIGFRAPSRYAHAPPMRRHAAHWTRLGPPTGRGSDPPLPHAFINPPLLESRRQPAPSSYSPLRSTRPTGSTRLTVTRTPTCRW